MRSRILAFAAALGLSAGAGLGQNLVAGGDFASDLEAWHHDPNPDGTSAWSALDAAGSASSGSALLTSTNATGGALVTLLDQCVPVIAGATYTLSADVRFTEGETTTGWAETAISWQSGPVCNTSISGNALLTEVASRGTWIHDSDTFTAPPGATSAFVQAGIDKIEAGGALSANFDNIFFGLASAPAEELVGYLAVAGSGPGNFGSFFRTSVQISNPFSTPISGHFVFHPAGVSASPSDPTMGFALGPRQSFAWHDVVAAMGLTGLGSIDVWGAGGEAPVIVARIFNDAGDAGTSGFTEPLVQVDEVSVPGSGGSVTGVLLCPNIVDRYRYNVGLRTVGADVHVTVRVFDSAGTEVHTASHDYPADYFVQTTVADFLDGFVIGDNYSLHITFSGGGLIIYGATVDNVTNDPSAQFMRYLFAIA
jgi:hypothetical protein